MLRGIYTAASGLNVQQVGVDVAANNIANLDTPGFKRDQMSAGSFPAVLLMRLESGREAVPIGQTCYGVQASAVTTDFSQGALENTGNSRDVALSGDGFLVAATPDGERYFRSGTLFVDGEGYLVTSNGDQVMGEDGPIKVGTGTFKIFTDGTVVAGEEAAGKLRVVAFPDSGVLIKEGRNYFRADAQPGAAEATAVQQGFLEVANVDLAREMVRLVEGVRAYQFCQRALRTHDELLGKAVNQVGRVG